jgi:cation:H+ antiporter
VLSFLQVLGGLAILVIGAEVMLRGSVAMAKRFDISTLVIGMTVVAFGTSAPELVVTVDAVLAGSPDVAVGNIVGSNIANLLLIVGSAALIMPFATRDQPMLFDAAALGIASLVFAAFCWTGLIPAWAGVTFLVALGVFVWFSYWREAQGAGDPLAASRREETEELAAVSMPFWLAIGAILLGLGGLIWGADLLVNGAIKIARQQGVSETVIGLTLIAIGTSLPELGASMVAAFRKQSDIAIGNVIGSNMFNILSVGGVASIVGPLTVAREVQNLHIWVMLGATVLFLPLVATRLRGGRLLGAVFLLLYCGYIAWIALDDQASLAIAPIGS